MSLSPLSRTGRASPRAGARSQPGHGTSPEVSSRSLPIRSPRTPKQIQQYSPTAETPSQSVSPNVSPATMAVFDNDLSPDAFYQTPDSSPGEDFDSMTREARHEVQTIEISKRLRKKPAGKERQNHAAVPLSAPETAARSQSSSSTTSPSRKRKKSSLASDMHDKVQSAPNSPRDRGNWGSTGIDPGKRTSSRNKPPTANQKDVVQDDLPDIEPPQIETPPTESPPGESPPDFQQPDPFNTGASPYGVPKFTRYNSEDRRVDSINMGIYKQLLAESTPRKPGSKLTGWIYIYESPSHAGGHVKVGQTKNDTSKRVKAWQRCKIPIQEIEDTDRDAFEHFGLVEKLIMEELNNERMQYTCPTCKRKHDEWYKIAKERAIKCRHRWRCWLKTHKPYDSRGVLTPYWQWKVINIKEQASRIDWDVWTNPRWYEKIFYGYRVMEPMMNHWGRHDFRFWLRGWIWLVLLYTRFRSWEPVLWGLCALLVV